jgi:transcriptional regulator with XRE-family HTH domain
MAHDGHCRSSHVTVSIDAMDGRPRGTHLRSARLVLGLTLREVAKAANWSPSRVRAIEGQATATERASTRYMLAVRDAFQARAKVIADQAMAEFVVST